MRRELKLKDERDFDRVYKSGKSTGNKYLVLYYLVEDEFGPTKVGFSISKKVGPAVTRNKLKRRLGEIVSHKKDQLKSGCLMVFVAKPAAAAVDFNDLDQIASDLLKRGALINN